MFSTLLSYCNIGEHESLERRAEKKRTKLEKKKRKKRILDHIGSHTFNFLHV